MSAFRVGAAVADITPPVGIRLSGFAGRPSGNTGVRDPVRAMALYLTDGDRPAVVLTLDVAGLSPADDARLRRAAGVAAGVSDETVLVACSHTHSGPATMEIRATGARENEWTEEVLARAAHAAGRACHMAQPAEMAVGSGCSFAAINRRLPTGEGIKLRPNPPGPVDHTCRVLLFRSGRTPVAIVVQYEMHPVVLGGGNLRVSADWVGHLREAVERRWDCPVLFLQGCCGDVNPRLHGDDTVCEMIGLDVAGSVLTALNQVATAADPRIGAGSAAALLPVQSLPDAEALRMTATAARERIVDLQDHVERLSSFHIAEADRDWAEACLAIQANGSAREALDARVSALAIGPVCLVGMPGEIFSIIGESVRDCVDGAWSVGYANGNLGYLYPDASLLEGGYEVDVAYRLYGEYQVGPGTARALIYAAQAAAAQARGRCITP